MLSAEAELGTQRLHEGMKNLQIAFLIEFVVGIIAVPYSFFKLSLFFSSGHMPPPLITWNIYFIINSIISLIGGVVVFYFLYRGFTKIREHIDGTDIGVWGTIFKLIGLIGGFIAGIFLIAYLPHLVREELMINHLLIVFGVTSIFGILGFIGAVFLGIALYRIGDEYGNTLVIIGGILYIFFSWLGAILLFVGLKDIETHGYRRKRALILPPPPPPPM